MITKYFNKSIHQRTERPQYSCHNPLNTDYNRGGEIGSQYQNNVEKKDLSQDWRLLVEVKIQDTISRENVLRYFKRQQPTHKDGYISSLSTVAQNDRHKKRQPKLLL